MQSPQTKAMGSSGSEFYWSNKDEFNINVLCNYLNLLIFISAFHSPSLLALFQLLSQPAAFLKLLHRDQRENTKAALILQINFQSLFTTQTNNWTQSFVM